MMEKLRQLVTEEEGQGMAEYGLILALIAVVAMVALGDLGGNVKAVFEKVKEKLVVPA